MDPGEAFITGLITGQHDGIGTSQNNDNRDNDPVDEDVSLFSSTSLDNLEARYIYRNGGARPDNVRGMATTNQHSENEPEPAALPILLDRFAPLPQNLTTDEINAEPSIPAPSTPQTNNGITKHDAGPNIPKGDQSLTRESGMRRSYLSSSTLIPAASIAVSFNCLRKSPNWSLCQRLRQRGLLLRGILLPILDGRLTHAMHMSIPERGDLWGGMLQQSTA